MKALKNYIESKNAFRRIFGQAEIKFPVTATEINELYDMLECDLSPENLHCDGEISRSAAAKKARAFNAALKDLSSVRAV